MSPDMRKAVFGVQTRSDINRPVQLQKMARSLEFQIYEGVELYYPNSENKGADQLCSYCKADLGLCLRIMHFFRFSHGSAHMIQLLWSCQG